MKSEAPSQPNQAQLWREVAADAALWFGFVLLLAVFRGVLFGWFHEELTPGTRLVQIIRCFLAGFRFDASVVTYVLAPLALTSILTLLTAPFVTGHPSLAQWHRRLRLALLWLLALVAVVVCIIDVGYFKEYHNQFNDWIFDMLFDDEHAIAVTIWKSYPIVWLVLLALVLTSILGGLLQRLSNKIAEKIPVPSFVNRWPARVFTALLLIFFFILGLRGSIGRRPVQLKDAAVCGDTFLDKIVLNPFSAYRYALAHHLSVATAPGLEAILPGGDVRRAAQALFPNVTATNLDGYLQKTASGSKTEKPRHIFLVVMESYDAWSMQPKYQSLHFTDRLQELGRNGIMAKAFVSAGHGTMPTLSSLITGLPEVGLHVNYRTSLHGGIPTSMAKIFKQLGYKTRFFYGGYLSWQRLGEFCTEQGFDEIHGGAAMSEHLSGNEWGVDDKVLFDYILKTTGDAPSFNVVMSTSYHPPYSINVEAEGFPLKTLPADLPECHASAQTLHEYGHLWYADRCLGDFVSATSKKIPSALFALTGDHFSRRCLAPRPTVQEQETVPFVLYGPDILKPLLPVAPFTGSHLDIIPTLVELSAPKGFIYHSFGHNLLGAPPSAMSFGHNTVITPDYISAIGIVSTIQSLSDKPVPSPLVPIEQACHQWQALGWWRVMKGNSL